MRFLLPVFLLVVAGLYFSKWAYDSRFAEMGESGMLTVEHDGHRWIRCSDGVHRWQPVHHPDCPCLKAP